MPSIHTDRLRLRPFSRGDLDALAAIYADEAVMRHIVGGPRDRAETRSRLDAILSHWEDHGYGYWAVIERGTETLIGECGLRTWKEWGETELHYIFASAHWGRGFAAEAAGAALCHGFRTLGLERIVAFAHPGNTASFRVMEKIGMRFERSGTFAGTPANFYALSGQDFERSVGAGH